MNRWKQISSAAFIMLGAIAVSCVDKTEAPRPIAIVPPPTGSASSQTVIAEPVVEVPEAAGTIACGDSYCQVGKAVCCRKGPPEEHRCHPNTEITHFAEHGACSAWAGFLLACDDSSDCPGDHICCSESRDQSVKAVCVPPRADGANACGLLELCTSNQSCRTAGTVCRDDPDSLSRKCQRPLEDISCGQATCTEEKPVCFGLTLAPPPPVALPDDLRCGTTEEWRATERPFTLKCDMPKDCPKGSYCHHSPFGSYCAGKFHSRNVTLVSCETDADCPPGSCPIDFLGDGVCLANKRCGCSKQP